MVRKRDVLLTCMLVLHVALGVQPPAASVNPAECRSLMDLYFVIDGSDSIDRDNYKTLREAMASMVPEIDLGPKRARIGMLVYSSHVPVKSKHTFSSDPGYLLNAAATLEHPRDGTDTEEGIREMIKIFKKDGRKGVPWVCVVITDGISKNATATILEAKKAAKMGISMFAVGIGQKIAIEELKGIASTDNQVRALNNFSELRHMLKSMMQRICPCPVPPKVPLAKCNDGARAIGSVRTYQCQNGYLQRGNPDIKCQSDFTWTPLAPDFECIPCSQNTPIVQHGTCSDGGLTIGTVRAYKCKFGYRAIGKNTIECLKSATWSVPALECVPCGATPGIRHAICGGDDVRIGAVRTYTCKPGYRLIGNANIECLDRKDWLRPQWSKPKVQCIPCGPTPDVINGICVGDDMKIGALRTYTCKPGYRLMGKATIECIDHKDWLRPQWSKPEVQCIPCGPTPDVTNGICVGDDMKIGSLRTYTCKPGYRLMGKATIECIDHKDWLRPQWSKPEVQCIPCGPTPDVINGICGGDDMRIGSLRTYTCKPGYRLMGKATIECIDQKDWLRPQWSKPEVQCIPCGPTPDVINGICGGDDMRIGSLRTYTCKPGYRLMGKATIECIDQKDWLRPQWSKPEVQCIPCGPTPDVINGICGGDDMRIGSLRTYTCKPGYRLMGKATIECIDQKDWLRPQWSKPEVQCIPCGPTPDVINGICGGDDMRIGSLRTYTCKPGYRLMGKATIECIDQKDWLRPQWSKPEVQCIPCGPTPDVINGICGGDDMRIGSLRTYTCKPGYRLMGKATIECIDQKDWLRPQWSKPEVQCIPCGPTPDVINGICGGDDMRIGALRTYTCKPGYRLMGKATIECIDQKDWLRPQWSKPEVQCIPCGPTPDVINGICGGDDMRIGALRTYTCKPGYRLMGKATIECIDQKDWLRPQWSKPEVQCIPCGPTPDVTNGICGGDDMRIGSLRTYTCKAGYRLMGKATIECIDQKDWLRPQWSKPEVQCIPCGPTPDVTNGICGGDDMRIGALRTYTCKPGYRLMGKATIECIDQKDWLRPQWSKPEVQCIPCGPTPDVINGICGGDDMRIGALRTYTCKPGYRLMGKATIECIDQKDWLRPQWSKPEVQCIPCGPTPDVINGICGGDDMRIGSLRTYTCKPGYRLMGKATIECIDQKDWLRPQWSKPEVQCIPCGPTPDVINGICGGDDMRIGSLRTYTCKPGYRLMGKATIECIDQKDWLRPQWSKPEVHCIPCGPTPDVTNGICGGDDMRIGSLRTYTCKPGYRLMGKATIECIDQKDWLRPQWSKPEVQCIPCGPTPDVINGICGGDDMRIGALRTYTCKAGYRLMGKATIECIDQKDWLRPQWSKPEVQCIPCGPTPDVINGICGGDDMRIGALRTYTCKPGYRLMGKATIECIDQKDWLRPQWSKPEVQCIPCGPTPDVTNGICGGDDMRIGSLRTYTCKPGYRLMGKATIECIDQKDWLRPQWSKPEVQCIPCGPTPDVINGICGGDDMRIGSLRTYTCKPGYRLMGKATIECIDQKDWLRPQWSKPEVQCIPCGPTPAVINGICGGDDMRIGALRTYTCKAGYRLMGKATIECIDQKDWLRPQWSKPEVQCIPCGPTPDVINGICGGDDMRIGSLRTYTCKPGYRLMGKATIECIDHKDWLRPQWSKPEVQCIPCGPTPDVINGICGGDDMRIGALRTYTCKAGYRLIGKATIECIDQKDWLRPQWSKPEVQCIPCGPTPDVINGICGGDDMRIGSLRTYTCKPGYRLMGKATIECIDQKDWLRPQWSKPEVQCIPCGPTPDVINGICGGDDMRIGSLRTYTCKPGYRLMGKATIECIDQKDWLRPQWSKPEVQCIPCGPTPDVINGICGGDDMRIGSLRTYTCKPGYRLMGKATIECIDHKDWLRPQWSKPEVQCIPCGPTPDVINGICGGDDMRIGALRTYTCKPGYRLMGKATIECIDHKDWLRPQWSKAEVQCIPCGPTPDVINGICGGDDMRIGALRTYTCKAGYRLMGKATIECIDHKDWLRPQWSKPEVQCIPCGPTPDVINGICGGDDIRIGALRTYTCKPGYRLMGKATIECIDHKDWLRPQWSKPEVQCISCGPTPDVTHGICGGDDMRIGALRTYTCKPGYSLKGNAKIECIDHKDWLRPQWSKPKVQCVPCGPTPVIDYAICKDGDDRIGSLRTYTCDKGYFLDGNSDITCLDDGTWSKPRFNCRDCGDPPIVPNAYTGTGSGMLGSKRIYYCESSFKMVGRGEIMCNLNGEWEKPRFRCEGIPPKTTSKDPSVCDGCRYLNGVAYNNHPFDCNQFVQCYKGNRGLEPVYRRCGFGEFWDQNVLTCRLAKDVNCPHDICKDPMVHSYEHADRTKCCAYWKCEDGRSTGDCCGEASSYNSTLKQCVTDYDCLSTCPYEDEIPVSACNSRPTRQDTVYEVYIGANRWVPMRCAPGTAYSPVDCQCSLFIMNVPGKRRQQVCKPELYIPFSDAFKDKSGKNVYVKPENVSIHNGAAYFNGNARILINRFANTEFTGSLVIKFRYNEFKNGDYFHTLQALVTNGDCGSDPSIVVAKMPGYVLLGAKAYTSKSFALPTLDKEWKEVIYIHNEKRLEGKVCGASMSKWSYGPIHATHCAVQIGYGHGLQSYVGLIDDLYIYQCRPRARILNLDY